MVHTASLSWRSCAGGLFRPSSINRALEVVKVANRSTDVPLNLITMKAAAASGSSMFSSSSNASSSYTFTSAGDAALLPPNTKASGSSGLRSISFIPSIASPEAFFFGSPSSTSCLLCGEDIEPPFTQRMHISASSRASHTNHTCREVSLDHIALLAMRGYPLDHLYTVWSHILYKHPLFTRIHALTSPCWSWEERAKALLPHLEFLREQNVLDISLTGLGLQSDTADVYYSRRRVAFERMEYIGDCAWGNNISNRLLLIYPNEQWLYSQRVYHYNCARDAVEMNITLELLFDSLELNRILPSRCADHVVSGKVKADVVEALLGELHCNVWGFQPELEDDASFVEVNGELEGPLLQLVQHCIAEIYDLLVLGYARELSWNAIPIAKVLASKIIWAETQPLLKPHKAMRYRRFSMRDAGEVALFPRQVLSPISQVQDFLAVQPLCSTTGLPTPSCDGEEMEDKSTTRAAPAPPPPRPRRLRPSVSSTPCFTLPAIPLLFSSPTSRPSRIPHPLISQENRPGYPASHPSSSSIPRSGSFEARLQLTTFEYTGKDVFGSFHETFEDLNLLTDDASHMCPKQSPAVVREAVQAYLGQTFPVLFHQANTTATSGTVMQQLEENTVGLYRDPYYQLFQHPCSPAPTVVTDFASSSEERILVGVKQGAALATPCLPAELASQDNSCTSIFGLCLSYALPSLTEEVGEVEEEDGQLSSTRKDLIHSRFQKSRWVPVEAKPPLPGAISEKHPLHPGAYAYLAVGIADPVESAMKKISDILEKENAKREGREQLIEQKNDAETKTPASEMCRSVVESTTKEGNDDEELKEKRRLEAWTFWLKRAQEQRASGTLYFPGQSLLRAVKSTGE